MAWTRRVEQLASAQKVSRFDRRQLAQAIPELAKLSVEPEGVTQVPAFLAHLGVRFVIVPHLERTYLDGAVLWAEDRPRSGQRAPSAAGEFRGPFPVPASG